MILIMMVMLLGCTSSEIGINEIVATDDAVRVDSNNESDMNEVMSLWLSRNTTMIIVDPENGDDHLNSKFLSLLI
jgi:hypothetical protein